MAQNTTGLIAVASIVVAVSCAVGGFIVGRQIECAAPGNSAASLEHALDTLAVAATPETAAKLGIAQEDLEQLNIALASIRAHRVAEVEEPAE